MDPRRTQPSPGEVAHADREVPTPRITGSYAYADHARLQVTKLSHLRTPVADQLRDRARVLVRAFDAWPTSNPISDERSRALADLMELAEQVRVLLGE